MYLYLALLAAIAWLAYHTGCSAERQKINQELQQQVDRSEAIKAEKKKVGDETKKQIKYEDDLRKKFRKQIEQEERTKQ